MMELIEPLTDSRSDPRSIKDSTLAIWETASGHLLGQFPLPARTCSSIDLSADGGKLAIGLPDGRIWICDFPVLLKGWLAAPAGGNRPAPAELWEKLAGDDAAAAYRAIGQLCEQPDAAVELLRDKLPALKPVVITGAEIEAHIKQLSSDDPVVRREASAWLLRLKPGVHPALRKALDAKPPDEVRARLEILLGAKSSATDKTLRGLRVVQVLERIGTKPARKLLGEMQTWPNQSDVTQAARAALMRLMMPRPAAE